MGDALHADMLSLLLECPADRSFIAADLKWSRPGPTGNALTRLAARGLLVRVNDPEKRGRCRYVLSTDGAAMANEAIAQNKSGA